MLGRIVFLHGIHTVVCVRVGKKRYHAIYYLIGEEEMVESIAPCDGACPKDIRIGSGVENEIRKRVVNNRTYPRRPRLAPLNSTKS